ncbi:phosphatidylglycerophosphatase A family protein [Orientia chuto str. Dubai]|uniref:Phosphatidylglycerophosphatase A n=1 Tax=Orientia chuto str. Dubai TaxID=1359168 RepID=A0A0F3MKD2_9RICK|nr:phosphatidylglycerophosphatase A [Candidatus Orientia mediorientalis]KJV56195.1 phosphatidylglycerophosphatase A family protein [Orientia chuto str. Dubai]
MIKFIELIVTFFYFGKFKFAPGTLGSLIALPMSLLVYKCLPVYKLDQFNITMLVVIVILFIIGSLFCQVYIEYYGVHDPREMIIDEVVGQMLAVMLVIPLVTQISSSSVLALLVELLRDTVIFISNSLFGINYMKEFKDYTLATLLMLILIFFRFFDIVKPWPVCFIDRNLNNGVGVMLDDIIAGLMAAIMVYILVRV